MQIDYLSLDNNRTSSSTRLDLTIVSKMWNTDYTNSLITKVADIYSKEILSNGNNSVEGLADHIDNMVAKAILIDKKIITIARQWRKIIERAAISEGIDKVEEILKQEELHLQLQRVDIVEVKEVEMTIEAKVHNEEENRKDKDIVEIEMDIRNENIDSEKEIKTTTLEEINIVENILELKSEEVAFEEKFERLDEELKVKYGNSSIDKSIWAPNKKRCEGKRDFVTRSIAANIVGKNAFQREKMLR